MSRESSQRAPRRHIPQEDLLVTAHAREPAVVLGHGDVQHFVPVSVVCLY